MMRCSHCRVEWCWECALPLELCSSLELCRHHSRDRVVSCVAIILILMLGALLLFVIFVLKTLLVFAVKALFSRI